MGIYLRDQDHNCLTNLRFADDVLLFATSKEQLQKMIYEFKESTEKVGFRIHPGKTKVLSNQSSISPDSEKRNANRRWQNWNLDKKWKREIRRAADYIPASRNDRNQKSYQDNLGDVPQIQAGADFKKLFAQTPLFDAATSPTICYASGNMCTHRRAWKNVTIGATQNASSHHTNKKEDTTRSRNTKLRTTKT